MKFSELAAAERAEIDALVHDAYVRPDGSVRSHDDASAEFSRLIAQAIQAQRQWPGILLDQWREAGERRFVMDRWKHSSIFSFVHKGQARKRTVNRGVRRSNDVGRVEYTQTPLWDWTADDLRSAIKDATRQLDEHRANLDLYRSMLKLIDITGCPTFQGALGASGMTWDEFLAARAA